MIAHYFDTLAMPALMVLCRLGGVAIFGPILGSKAVPMKARALLTVALAGACAPLVIMPSNGTSLVSFADRGAIPLLVAGEIAIGAVIGLLASIPLIAAQIGGLLCSQQLGLGFGRFYLPAMDDEGDALEQVFFLFALMLFISIGGIEQLVLAVAESYRWLPPASLSIGTIAGATTVLVGLLGGALELGLRVAAPVLAIVALESIALGFVGRTMPALNVLSVGFALRIAAGIAIMALGVGVIRMAIDGFIDEALGSVRMWATGGAG